MSAFQHCSGGCHSKCGTRQRLPWHDLLSVSQISWLSGWHRHYRQHDNLQEFDWKSKTKIDVTKTKYLLVGGSVQLGSNVLVDANNLEVVKDLWISGRSLLRTTTSAAKSGHALCRGIVHTMGFSICWDPEDFETARNVRYIAHWFSR